MFGRITRIIGSFALVVTAYGAYSLLAVPMIEPEAVRPDSGALSEEDAEQARNIALNQRKDLRYWFRDGDWELSSPKILETEQGKLLLRTHERLEDPHFVKMTPCSLIFLPEGEFDSEEEQYRQAIVLRAPEGAILQFDRPFDLKRGDISSKVVGGELLGPVTIRSDQRLPGPEDDLWIETRDVKLTDNHVVTPHRVKFRQGFNRGEGEQLYIELATPAEKAAQPAKARFGSMKRLELARNVHLRMLPGNANLFPSGPNAPAADDTSGKGRPQPPVEVTCQGPFHFDLIQYVATFHDHVTVLRLNPQTPSDQLTCEVLDLYFEAGAAPAEAGSPKLRPKRVVAKGNPVVLTSPSNGVQARGQLLEYDVEKQSGKLFDKKEASLRQEGGRGQPPQEIHAQELEFQADPQNPSGPPKMMIARGKGWLRGNAPPGQAPSNKSQEPLHARWEHSLTFLPYEQYQLLSVRGKAHVEAPGSGGMDAEEIHVWLKEVSLPPVPGALSDQPPQKKLVPAKMNAKGSVRMTSPQLDGAVGEIQAWFDQPPPAAPVVAASPGSAPAPQPAPQPAAEPVGPKQRFHVSGNLLQLKALLPGDAGGPAQIKEVILNGSVRCKETQTLERGEKPLEIVGDQLHLVQQDPQNAVVTVTGRPACVDARGMHLEGGTDRRGGAIHLNRASNKLWIDDVGFLSLPADRDLNGKPLPKAANQRLEISWTGRMNFDGRSANFEENVFVKRLTSELRAPLLRVDFARQIRFGASGSNDQPEVDRIVCGPVVDMKNVSYDERGILSSIERLHSRELIYKHATGDLLAKGPDGWVTRVWLDRGDSMRSLPGGASQKTGPNGSPRPRGPQLMFLKVKFARQMAGNQQRKINVFENQVSSIFSPIADWRMELDPEQPGGLGEQGFTLRCDRLTVSQSGASASDDSQFEMTADGNSIVEGREFLARSSRLKYERSKDLLTLDGDGLAKAQLFREKNPGEERQGLSARKIWFWPSTNDIKMDDFGSLEFSDLTTSKPKQTR